MTQQLTIDSPQTHQLESADTPRREPTAAARLRVIGDRCMDASIIATFWLAPFVLGGRHPIGKFALAIAILPGTCGLFLRVMSGARLNLSPLQCALLAACFAIPAIQTSSQINKSTNLVAPGIERLFSDELPINADQIARQTPSVSAINTQRALPTIIIFVCLFTFLRCRIRSWNDAENLIVVLLVSCLLIAIVAILQANFGNGKFLWIYDHPTRDPGSIPRGPFQNENHLSSMLASALPLAICLLIRGNQTADSKHASRDQASGRASKHDHGLKGHRHRNSSRHKNNKKINYAWTTKKINGLRYPSFHSNQDELYRIIAAATCVAIICTIYATPSRGGTAICAVSALLFLVILLWRWLGVHLSKYVSLRSWLIAGFGIYLLGLFAIAWVLNAKIAEWSYWRAKIWATDYAIWKDFPWFGVGVGNHPHVYRAYLNEYVGMTFSHSESSWLQYLVETGVLGSGLALVITSIVLHALLKQLAKPRENRQAILLAAVAAGLLASLLHATFDFPWHIPACFAMVVALTTIACQMPSSQPELAPRRNNIFSTLYPTSIVTALLFANAWSINSLLPPARASIPWDACLRASQNSKSSPSENDELIGGNQGHQVELLRETLQIFPQHIPARLKLANYLATQITQFDTTAGQRKRIAVDTLRQSALAIHYCPTESRSYMYAAKAGEHLGMTLRMRQKLLAQSQRLRPVDGYVAMQMGMNELLMADQVAAEDQFAIALEADPFYRPIAIQTLLVIYPIEKILTRWQPSRDAAAELFLQTSRGNNKQAADVAGRYYLDRLVAEATASNSDTNADYLLDVAYKVAQQLNDINLEIQILERRVTSQPDNTTLLLELAQANFAAGNMSTAKQVLNKCQQLSPRDVRIRKLSFQIDKANSGLR